MNKVTFRLFSLLSIFLLFECPLEGKSLLPNFKISLPNRDTTNSLEILYNIDGIPATGLGRLKPVDIAYIQVLDAVQSQFVFEKEYSSGVIYVTTQKKRSSEENKHIQEKIDALHPRARSYFKLTSPSEDRLNRAIYYAETQNWLILINNIPATIEALKQLSPGNITILSYQGGDFSHEYGEKAKEGIVKVSTKN